MNEMLLILVIAYVFLTALLLLTLIYSRLQWLLKAGLITVAIVFYWFSYQGWKETQGWPSQTELPERFLLHAAVVTEPDEDLGLAGEINLWLSDLGDNQLAEQPRAYRLPYDRGLHSRVQEAQREMNNGNLQLGISRPSANREKEGSKKKRSGQLYPDLQFERLPDPSLPEK